MRKLLLLAPLLVFTQSIFAQQNIPYAEKAAQIQKDVWGNPVPEFKATAVPAGMSNESAVILARSFNLQRTTKPRLKFMLMGAGVAMRTAKLSTFHERVKINDKAALDEFSTLEYQKKLDNTTSFLFNKIVNVSDTYIGVKIIKPNGSENIVNTGEEVLLKNEQKDQKGKLAIPGLQVGDIVDYYISNASMTETDNSYRDNDNLLLLTDQHPILYYSIDFQFSKKVNVQYICANGAPKFQESNNENDDLLLSIKGKNLPKYQSQLWTSPLRQYPYVEVGSTSDRDKSGSRLDALTIAYESLFHEMSGFDAAVGRTKEFFGSRKNLKNAPLDSLVKVLYDEWKYQIFAGYSADELQEVNELNYRTMKSTYASILMSMMLKELDVDNSVLLVAPRNANSLDNAFNMEDVDAMVVINTAKPIYLGFDDIVTHFNEIPARFQGEEGIQIFPTRHNAMRYTFESSRLTLPVVQADRNVEAEDLQVSFLPNDAQKLKINRTVSETGELRHIDQKLLIPVADVDEGYRKLVNGDELTKRLKEDQRTKKMTEDFNSAFAKQKADMVKNFTTEIKEVYDQDPEQVQDTKIVNPAIENTDPAFVFSESFVMNNLVKKAGNNYIIDAGKLVGTFTKLEDKDRKRTMDVYMPCARTFKYNIALTVPPGYTVKGMQEMTVKKTNKTGSFSSTATVNGNTLTIFVYRVYNNNFEKAADWPLVAELVDAASNFGSQKILLQKN